MKEVPLSQAKHVEMPKYDKSRENPTTEELFIREAIKRLTREQREIWEMYAYDKLTQDEIATKLKKTHQAISQRIATIEKKITKWIQNNMGAYNLLKAEMNDGEEDI